MTWVFCSCYYNFVADYQFRRCRAVFCPHHGSFPRCGVEKRVSKYTVVQKKYLVAGLVVVVVVVVGGVCLRDWADLERYTAGWLIDGV